MLSLLIFIILSLLYSLLYRFALLHYKDTKFTLRWYTITGFWLFFIAMGGVVAALGFQLLVPADLLAPPLANNHHNPHVNVSNAIGKRDFDPDFTMWAKWPLWRMDTVYLVIDVSRPDLFWLIAALVAVYGTCWCASVVVALLTLYTLRKQVGSRPEALINP